MSPSISSQKGSDGILAEVVEEFTNRVQAGEPVDVESYAQRHPELAERIRQLLPALALLAEVGCSGGAARETAEDRLAGTLGDFRIGREVGRGGMGVVYEAEQISLRRRVALKVLPFAATMDPRHLQRFHNEAQAAACLHHTNIVPVFFVGCERGVHFYAMQFIDGQPLSDLIHQLRQWENKTPPVAGEERTIVYQPSPGDAAPTPQPAAEMTPLASEGRRSRDYFRKVAELGVQAAEALDHAHQLGIVHRDIKPGNLLLDGRGNVWVTDFGLAHVQYGEVNLTVTGQAVGTPRYMSPEQALAKREPIDHRTDVYSLGATLYELLTLRPAFRSEDRQELLRQIVSDDPAKPRRLERAIPTELEIIVLKAMEKRPQDRYATSQELADDLRRWLLDHPIRARRPTVAQRLRKWGRRHRPLVFAAVLSLFLALILLAISNLVILHEHEETKEALQKARLHQQEVELLVGRMNGDRDKFEMKLQRSLESMDSILTALEEPFPEKGTEAARMLQGASDQALKFYQTLLPLETHRPSLIREMMWAYVRLGNLYALRNQFAEARQAYDKAGVMTMRWFMLPRTEESFEEEVLSAISPDGDFRDRPAVEKAYRRALAHWRKTSPKELADVEDFRQYLVTQPPLFSSISPRDSEHLLHNRLKVHERILEDLPTLSRVHGWIELVLQCGRILQEAGQFEEAKALYRQAVKLARKGIAQDLTSKEDRKAWASRAERAAHMLLEIGSQFDDLNALEDAESAVRVSAGLFEKVDQYDPGGKSNIAIAHTSLGNLLIKKGQFRQAAECFRRAHEFGSRNPSWPNFSAQFVRNCERLAKLEDRLPAILNEPKPPADAADCVALAWWCQLHKQSQAAAARFHSAAFAADPKLADDLDMQHRYNAACAAALAGCGQGTDADKLDKKELARLRQQALDWLRADLQAYRQMLDKSPDETRLAIWHRMHHWQDDSDFAGVRDSESLARLPEAERAEWQQLWERDIPACLWATGITKPQPSLKQTGDLEKSATGW